MYLGPLKRITAILTQSNRIGYCNTTLRQLLVGANKQNVVQPKSHRTIFYVASAIAWVCLALATFESCHFRNRRYVFFLQESTTIFLSAIVAKILFQSHNFHHAQKQFFVGLSAFTLHLINNKVLRITNNLIIIALLACR